MKKNLASNPTYMFCACRHDFAMKRGFFLGTISQKAGKPMRMFDVANVRPRYWYPVSPLTRPEIHSTLLHYHKTGKFLMLSSEYHLSELACEVINVSAIDFVCCRKGYSRCNGSRIL